MPYPYDYSYFKPTGKEQAAMGIGSLLAGLLSAAQPRQPGEASPVLKGIQGAVAGYGGGYKTYQDMMNEAYGRNLADRKFGQQVKEYEETDKPYKDSYARWNDVMSRNTDFDNQMAFDKMVQERLNAKKNERFNTRMNQMNMALKKNEVVNSRPRPITEKIKPAKMPDVGNYGKLQAQLAALKSNQNMDYLGMPADERAKRISALENSIRLMEQYQPELIPPQQQTQQIPQQNTVIPEGKTGIDKSNNKKTIFRNGRGEYAD